MSSVGICRLIIFTCILNVGETHVPYWHVGAPGTVKTILVSLSRAPAASDDALAADGSVPAWSMWMPFWPPCWRVFEVQLSSSPQITVIAGAKTGYGSTALAIAALWKFPC